MESKSKRGHHKRHWDVWLGTRKQRLAAFTVLLMLALGIVSRGDSSQPYLHNESMSSGIFVGQGGTDIYEQSHLHREPSWVNSSVRGTQVDSGAAASVNTGTDGLRLLATLGIDINVVTNDAVGNALFGFLKEADTYPC
ncbi:MAG: hypothetical protein ABSG07_11835 [Terriglobales bacterium]